MDVPFQYNPGDWRKAPNLISYVRLAGSWLPGYLVVTNPHDAQAWWWATGIFMFVAATDVLDGYVARRFNLITDLGKFVDPLVDKLLVLFTLIGLGIVDPWLWLFTAIIAVRELVITLQIRRRSKLVAAIRSGKLKMLSQVVAIIALLVPLEGGWLIVQLALIGHAVFWTVFSWIDYYQRFVR
ncbi:CDP-diacylglycerol--glycerol-3-phosphate 3-phosphatidyltransferase [Candidatus Saccharibacteria bacterium]|nr:CDP-diacylglycerol--glycerol-3-phosphate 3-phosphatidyltransferase [Candidatus Saccharibacteria bacterium]